MCEGRNPLELSTMIRDDARAFSFVVRRDQAGPVSELALPEQTRLVCLYRDDELVFPGDDTHLRAEDEVVVVTHRDKLETLSDRLGAGRDRG